MSTPRIWLIRHGETEWSRAGRHTGLTDLPLTAAGEAAAEALRGELSESQCRARAVQPAGPRTGDGSTGRADPVRLPVDDLREWDYGAWEGRTTAEIRA